MLEEEQMGTIRTEKPSSITAGTVEDLFTEAQAIHEAAKCLQCYDPPCTKNCPTGIVIPRFIRMIQSGNYRGAAEAIRYANPMALSCGLACPSESLCVSVCNREQIDAPIAIRRLHRFATEWEERNKPRNPMATEKVTGKVAIIGSGPAGLACASELRRYGVKVTVFEKEKIAGGVLAHIIPSYRLGKAELKRDVNWTLGKTGVKGSAKLELGRTITDLDKLSKKYDALFVAPGISDHKAQLPGDDLKGVSIAHEFLTQCRRRNYRNIPGSEVVVLGGGNVAVDAAIAAMRCGQIGQKSPAPNVQILYRRTRAQMPAWDSEIRDAEAAGVSINYLIIPLEFVGARGRVTGIKVSRARLSDTVVKGRPRPVAIPDTEFVIPCDQAILAMGMSVDQNNMSGLIYVRRGYVRSNKSTGLVKENIFAGGDAAGADQMIATAVKDAKTAANAILDLLRK
jgi:NADPH-dependent glutamate synthase beta subunit-like oxidoreductase